LEEKRPKGDFKPKHAVELLFTRSTDSHLQYTNGFNSTSGNPSGHQNFCKPLFRGAIGEFPNIFPLKKLFNRSTDFYNKHTDRFRLTIKEKKVENSKKFHISR
jgi:hypothetical protein